LRHPASGGRARHHLALSVSAGDPSVRRHTVKTAHTNLVVRQEVHVEDLRPALGLAYVGDGERSWTITRATPGPGVEGLYPGQALSVLLRAVDSDTWVVEKYDYAPA